MSVGDLILRVHCVRQCLDRREVQLVHSLQVADCILDSAHRGSISQVERQQQWDYGAEVREVDVSWIHVDRK